MKKLKTLLSLSWPPLFIAAVWAGVVWTNYVPQTWLLGWDSLLPELDFSLNIKRSLLGTWQEYQGLGLTGGMGHNADVVRQILLWLASAVIPLESIRYFWTFLMLLVGPIGAYSLIKHVIRPRHKTMMASGSLLFTSVPALAGGLFYLLNLATVQYFYTPLETFSSFYGFLPWLIWGLVRYLELPRAKRLFQFGLLSLLASSAFHVQTLFVVFLMVCSVFVGEKAWRNRAKRLDWKHIFKPLGVTLAVHAFWLIPVIYFTLTSASNTVQSHQNQISTPESQLMNQGFGGLSDLLLLKGYWFEYTDFSDDTNGTVFLLEEWRQHLDNPLLVVFGNIIAGAAITGIAFAVKKRLAWSYSFAGVGLLSLVMLSSGKGLLGILFDVLSLFPLFSQIFRTSFTKWSMVEALVFAIGLGWFVQLATARLAHWRRQIALGISAGLIGLSIYLVFPLFSGQLIYDAVQQQMPPVYSELFEYLKSQPAQARIVHLPASSFWGWSFNDWGYRGSGFLWYGIEQPIIDRNFDVWSPANETLYLQLSQALYDQDIQGLENVIEKYDITYALVDESIISPGKTQRPVEKEQTELFLSSVGAVKIWEKDFLALYAFDAVQDGSFVNSPRNYSFLHGETDRVRVDSLYKHEGTYLTGLDDTIPRAEYPFHSLSQLEAERLTVIPGEVQIASDNHLGGKQTLILPSLQTGSYYAGPTTIVYQEGLVTISFISPGYISSGQHKISLPAPNPVSIPVSEDIFELVVSIENYPIEVAKGETKTVWLKKLQVGSPLSFAYFDKSQASYQGNEILVTQEQLKPVKVDAQFWSPLLKEHVLSLPAEPETLQLTLATQEQPIDFTYSNPGYLLNCDAFDRGTAKKNVTDSLITYIADDRGAVCEGQELYQTLTDHSHILHISGENKSGRELKVFIENLGNSQIVLETLVENSKFDSTFPLLSWKSTPDNWHSLNLEARSLGGEKNEITIAGIQALMLPFDISWITSIKLMPSETVEHTNALIVNSVKKWGTGVYLVDTFVQPGANVLSLSQSFDNGWLAFSTSHPGVRIEHLTYNGWANAWLINSSLDEPQTKTFALIYVPQLLTFVGYGVSIATLTVLAVKTKNDKRSFYTFTALRNRMRGGLRRIGSS